MKGIAKLFSLLGTLLFAFASYNHLIFGYGFQDTLARTFLFSLFSTSWAEGFTEEKFLVIKPRMSEDAVIHLIGKPLRKTCSDDLNLCEWVYSWQSDPTASFDRRAVYFDNSGYVIKTRKDVFID